MAKIVRYINIRETLNGLQPGETIEINYSDASEPSIRNAAWRLSKEKNIELTVSSFRGATSAVVKRIS